MLLQIFFNEIPEEVIDKLVGISLYSLMLLVFSLGKQNIVFCHLDFFFFTFQVEEGTVLNVAGGLIIEHPLILPYVKEVVSFPSFFLFY